MQAPMGFVEFEYPVFPHKLVTFILKVHVCPFLVFDHMKLETDF